MDIRHGHPQAVQGREIMMMRLLLSLYHFTDDRAAKAAR